MAIGSAEVSLAISGPLTLAEVGRWHEAWLSASDRAQALKVDLSESGPWDLAGLQLILSGLASANRGGTTVRLVHPPEVCLAIAEQAGVVAALAPYFEEFPD